MGVVTRKVKDDEQGMRLDRWFREHYPTLPFGHLQKLLRTGQVRVDGGRARTSTRLEAGQSVRVPPLAKASPEAKGRSDRGEGRENERGGPEEHSPAETKSRAESPRSAKLSRGKEKSDAEFLKSITLYE